MSDLPARCYLQLGALCVVLVLVQRGHDRSTALCVRVNCYNILLSPLVVERPVPAVGRSRTLGAFLCANGCTRPVMQQLLCQPSCGNKGVLCGFGLPRGTSSDQVSLDVWRPPPGVVGNSRSCAVQFPPAPADVFIDASAVEVGENGGFDVTLALTGPRAADVASDPTFDVVVFTDAGGGRAFRFEAEEEVDGAQVFEYNGQV